MSKDVNQAHKATHTYSDTQIVDEKTLEKWRAPPFQRPLRVNAKVAALAEAIRADGGVIPGVITLGKLKDETFLLDGQHRMQAFLSSGHKEGYADLRIHEFPNMAAMGKEFVNLNSRLVTLRPDDILRGLEPSMPTLQGIRKRCPFVGYDKPRRSNAGTAPFLSMSAALRAWFGSEVEAPSNGAVHGGTVEAAARLTLWDASTLSEALLMFEKAWSRDVQYSKLWGVLNMTMCLWIYRRVVLDTSARTGQGSGSNGKRSSILTKEQFTKAMMSVSAESTYLDWLYGRTLTERDRSPCYKKLKDIIARRIAADTKKKPIFPLAPWL